MWVAVGLVVGVDGPVSVRGCCAVVAVVWVVVEQWAVVDHVCGRVEVECGVAA